MSPSPPHDRGPQELGRLHCWRTSPSGAGKKTSHDSICSFRAQSLVAGHIPLMVSTCPAQRDSGLAFHVGALHSGGILEGSLLLDGEPLVVGTPEHVKYLQRWEAGGAAPSGAGMRADRACA
jgi:hypothetical protein